MSDTPPKNTSKKRGRKLSQYGKDQPEAGSKPRRHNLSRNKDTRDKDSRNKISRTTKTGGLKLGVRPSRRASKQRTQESAHHQRITREQTQLVVLNKPFNTICQFSGEDKDTTLASWVPIAGVYPAGRLDKDSEGLLLLTNNGRLQHLISHPQFKQPKTYWVQVEGSPSPEAIHQLRSGVILKDGLTRPARCEQLDTENTEACLWPRIPPVRYRAQIPTTWLSLTIYEGRNRQVRRMTAAVGHPTLRLVRMQMGPVSLDGLQPGEYRLLSGLSIEWPGF